jgi:hypothetical protein
MSATSHRQALCCGLRRRANGKWKGEDWGGRIMVNEGEVIGGKTRIKRRNRLSRKGKTGNGERKKRRRKRKTMKVQEE